MSREFKNSGIEWVKQIPSNWNIIKGRHLLFLPNRPVRPTDDVVTCFRDGEVILRSERRTEGFTMSDKEIGYQGINKGDIVIHGMDGFAGAMGVSKSTGKGSPVLIVCNPKENDIPQYIIYYLRSLAMTNVFLALATGIRERSCDLRWKKIAELPFLRPSFLEQQKIANYLDKVCGEVDEMIALQEQMIEELKAYKQSFITEAVTKGLNPDVPMKDSGIDWIGEVPEHWNVCRMKNIATGFTNGTSITQLPNEESPYAVTRIETISSGNINYKKVGYVPFFEGISKYLLIKGDILISNINSLERVGNSAIYNGEQTLYHGMNLLRVHTNERMIDIYLLFYLRSKAFLEQMKSCCNHAINQVSVSSSTLKNIFVATPPLSEQQSIASYLDEKCAEIDALIAIKQSKIEELKEYKKSVIYEYVTGKKEVV